MDRYKELVRLINNIKKGRFNHKRYAKRRKYYGFELHLDSAYTNGGFGLSVYDKDDFLWWIYYNPSLYALNIDGIPANEVLLKKDVIKYNI